MKSSRTGFLLAAFPLMLSACATSQFKLAWRVRDMVQAPAQTVRLVGPNQQVMASVDTLRVKKLLLAHFRITRAAGIQAELMIVEGEKPNAFAGIINSQATIGVNIGMLNLIGDDLDEFAYLLGHEAAHLAKGHVEASRTRSATLGALGTLVGIGLGSAGVPAGGAIAGLAIDLVEASYSRDQEREADALGVGYVMSAGFDARGAILLHEKMIKASRGSLLPFLSSHPSGEERVANLKEIISNKAGATGSNP